MGVIFYYIDGDRGWFDKISSARANFLKKVFVFLFLNTLKCPPDFEWLYSV